MSSQEQIRQAVLAFINGRTWYEKKRVVETHHRMLLSPSGEVEHIFDELLAQYEDDEGASNGIKQLGEILSHCAGKGIDATFAQFFNTVPSLDLDALQDEIEHLTRSQDMPRRIQACQEALSLVERTTQPLVWASLQFKLANSLYQNPLGNRADNLEQAIYYYGQSLEIRTREALPQEWADVQKGLATAYLYRIRGNRAENIEKAIAHHLQALQVRTRQAYPQPWADSQNGLANAYVDRIKGERKENIEQAIYHYQQALQATNSEAFPQEWSAIHNNLGTVYRARVKGQRADNIEKAIYHYKQAFQVRTREAFPEEWANTQNNLAVAYQNRIKGERAENLEQAIFHYGQALEVRTRQAYPEKWAMLQNNLAVTYWYRRKGERPENIEQAIYHYKQALQVRTRQAAPFKWANTQNNLAAAHWRRFKGQREENVEQAIYHYNQALQVYTQQDWPSRWAMSHHNLAAAYRQRIKGVRAENIEQAIYHYNLSLRIRTRDSEPVEWAKGQNNLANVYLDRIHGEKEKNIEQAIYYYRQALEIFTPRAFPTESRARAYLLGRLCYDQRRFFEARQALEISHQAVEALWREVQRSAAKERIAHENADIYARLVHTCLLKGDKVAAFEYTVAGKGRAFVDTLASGGFDISAKLAQNPALITDWNKFDSLRKEINYLRTRQKPIPESKQKELDTKWEDLTFKYPNLTATQQAPRLTASEAMTLAADLHATLIEYVQHKGGWSAFVITQDSIEHVPLDKVYDQFLNGIIKWIKNIEKRKRVFFNPRTTRKQLTQLYTVLIAPLQEQLPPANEGERLVIAPFGALHQLPINAAQNPDTLSYLSEAYTLTFTPSLAALRASLDSAKQASWSFRAPENAIHIAYAGHEAVAEDKRLQKVHDSANEMAQMFPLVTLLSSQESTPDAVAKHVANQELIHFYCHGIFEPDNPNQSGLLLHDGFLTVQRIITDLDLTHTHLTALAACQTGRVGVRQGEELVGLIQALLIAGSKSVVATLWKVDETPTQAFFQHFYRAIKDGDSPAEALSRAAQAIRKTKGWAHPYYWAAFQISGLVYDIAKPMGLTLDENA